MAVTEKLKTWPNGSIGIWLRFVLSALVIPILLFVMHIDRRVLQIESNRFTAVDAKAVYESLGDLERKKANKTEVPPPEVEKEFDLVGTTPLGRRAS